MEIKHHILSTIFLLFCTAQALANAIPAEHIGVGKWVTLKTENGYYFYAIEEEGQIKLGQTQSAPNADNYAAYCWQIEGDETNGYTFRCLKYENDQDGKKYITNPATLATNSQEVRLTTTPSRYNYTGTHQLQLVENTGLFLAFYSRNYHTIRLHNSADYVGSHMIIGGIYDWSVAAVVYGTETEGDGGLPQGTYLPNGGIVYSGKNYTHGSSLYLADVSNLSLIPISGYAHSTIKIDNENRYIVAYYVGEQSGITYTNATTTKDSETVVTGTNGTIWVLNAKDYITNTSTQADGTTPKYTTVPADKAWQMEMVVENTTAQGQTDPSFNKWGSCILSSCGDPLNTYYWGDFQVYQHSPTHSSPNTLNFKSSKGDGNDHIIAQGASVANKSYKVIVRYNGNQVYVIRTIILDNNLQETNEVYNNVWVSARPQVKINQMSCAIPTGINLKSLRISIAEDSNLLDGVDYAIQNIDTKNYLTGGNNQGSEWYSQFAGDAAKFQIEWTNNNDLTYSEGDGGLHHSFYIKIIDGANVNYMGADNTKVNDKANAQAFIYTTNNLIAPITAQNTLGTAWTIDTHNTWYWDFFANFYVEVAGNNDGGLLYQKGGNQQTATNNTYIELPSGVLVEQMANSSQAGYSAAITKADIRLKVQYNALENTFYNITAKTLGAQPVLYYWYKNRPTPSLITYSTTNSKSGAATEWGDKGDCSKFTIEKVTTIPVKVSKIDNRYYGSIFCPNALTLPSGIKAYRLNRIDDKGNYMLKPIDGDILPASTPAVLMSEDDLQSDPSGDWTVNVNDHSIMNETNLFSGVFEDTANPGAGQGTSSTTYTLGKKTAGVGFYPYTAANIPAFKAYHNLGATQGAAPARFAFFIDSDNTLTSIDLPVQTIVPEKGIYYDTMGRATTQPVRGRLYIINGRKVIY